MDWIWNDTQLILAGVAVGAILAAGLKDLVNSLFRGRTRIVLQSLSTHRGPGAPGMPSVELTGRRKGLLGFVLARA